MILEINQCPLLEENAMIKLCNIIIAFKIKGFFGQYLIVSKYILIYLFVLYMNLMSKWIKEEEILKEILKVGGNNFTIKMVK